MKTRRISSVATALALSAAVTLAAQGQAPPAGGGAGAAPQAPPVMAPGGIPLTAAAARLLPKAINAPDIKFEVVRDFMKLPPNVYMGEGIGVAQNSKGH